MKAMYWSKAKLLISMKKVLIFFKLLHLVLLPSYSLQGINGDFFRIRQITRLPKKVSPPDRGGES